MIKMQSKKSKPTQYVIGGTVAVIILGLWVSLPLMNGGTADSSVSAGNPFRSKVADISSLGSEGSSEIGAPGSPLSGEMINNPATSGEEMASSLFQSGPSEEEAPAASASADQVPAASGPGGVPSASGAAPAAPRGKLAAAASITGGNSNSMTAGGVHNKFFGSGNQKAEIAPAAAGPDMKKLAPAEKRSSLVAMLGNSADKSIQAAKSGNMDAAKGGAASAFGGTSGKGDTSDLNSNLETQSMESGLQMGQTAQDLKKNDPGLNKHKVTLPEPKVAKDEDADAEMKKQIMQMIIQAVLKVALGSMGL